MQNFKFDYDQENDDLFLFSPKSKSRGSVELGKIILDFNSRRELVGIEMLDASELIGDMVESKDSKTMKELLINLKGCKVNIKVNGNILFIKMCLISKNETIAPMLSVPTIKHTSPALKYA